MKKLTAILMLVIALLWAGAAFAQEYSALGDTTDSVLGGPAEIGFWAGGGGLYLSGDNGAGNGDSAFIPTVNIGGLTDFVAWQAFYGLGSDTTIWGGTLDYIVADNKKDCIISPTLGKWWFGVGATYMDASDLYFDSNDATAALSDSFFGGNLGFGYLWDKWSLNVYAHYLNDNQLAFQGALMYDVN